MSGRRSLGGGGGEAGEASREGGETGTRVGLRVASLGVRLAEGEGLGAAGLAELDDDEAREPGREGDVGRVPDATPVGLVGMFVDAPLALDVDEVGFLCRVERPGEQGLVGSVGVVVVAVELLHDAVEGHVDLDRLRGQRELAAVVYFRVLALREAAGVSLEGQQRPPHDRRRRRDVAHCGAAPPARVDLAAAQQHFLARLQLARLRRGQDVAVVSFREWPQCRGRARAARATRRELDHARRHAQRQGDDQAALHHL
eukprot:CAMPEP_0197406492 /NCGR_PEP_ID=MMETSP1165-20131217/25834_1 /TAXON_ID=284809 /ORGANISM="Chrysocystis fragilis, Strain CCMP3189" /LENGTH=256 /DNA_ID=CAMNT_0042932839 /DNA_START=54 /DNA_END=820 /DNA_ORIENTATION=-